MQIGEKKMKNRKFENWEEVKKKLNIDKEQKTQIQLEEDIIEATIEAIGYKIRVVPLEENQKITCNLAKNLVKYIRKNGKD